MSDSPSPTSLLRGSDACPSLRAFLDAAETSLPGTVWRVTEPLRVRHEITALQHGLERIGRRPVVIVENPVLDDGTTSAIPVVTNLMASRRLAAGVLGVSDHRQAARELSSLMGDPVAPVMVDRSEAPANEKRWAGSGIDLRRLPALVQHALDPGPYLSAAHATTYDPDSAIDNTAIQRAWVRGPRELRFFPYPSSHNWANITKWWERGKDAPVTLWIGHHPALDVGANQKISYPESHWDRAGGILGQPVRLMETESEGPSLRVPADTEIVIEGRVLAHEYRAEGPFGEFTGYSGAQRPSPVIEVDIVTSRERPMYHDYASGLPDMLVPDNMLLEATLFAALAPIVPAVMAIHVPCSGRRFHCYVQLLRPGPGEAEMVIRTVLANRRIKHVIVVDEDVDVFDEPAVLWAVATRVQWTRDVIVITGADTSSLDPSLPSGVLMSDKAGIDATLPSSRQRGWPRPTAPSNLVGSNIDAVALVQGLAGGLLDGFPAE